MALIFKCEEVKEQLSEHTIIHFNIVKVLLRAKTSP